MIKIRKIWFLLAMGILFFIAPSCNTTKYLEKEKIILVEKNTVEIISKEKIDNKTELKLNLASYHKQKTNSKFLGLFRTRLWFFHKHQAPTDTTKWDNWVRRILAEPPVILKNKLTDATAEAMKSHMLHNGYFNAKVEHEIRVDSSKFLAFNNYKVYPNKQYVYDNITYVSKDEHIQLRLNESQEGSFLKKGDPVDVDMYDKEVNRLVKMLRNRGYFDFNKNFVSPLAVDTINYEVDATLNILSPVDKNQHAIYRVGNVHVYPNYNPDFRELYVEENVANGITYMSVGNPAIRFETLDRNIKLREGDLYNLDNEEKTKNRLGSLGLYKFISIKPIKREGGENIVDFKIYLPSKKRQELGGDVELNTANNTTLNNTSIGTALSLNYKNKNLFKGAEIFSANLQGGLEFAISDRQRLFNSVDVVAATELNIPKFVDYAGFYTLLNKIKILPDKNYNKLKETASTRIKLAYNYLELIDFYTYNSMDASFGYNIKPSSRWRIQYNQTGLTYFNPRTEVAFDTILNQNQFLAKSFGKQLFTGLFARDVQATYIASPKKPDVSWSAKISGEISGLEILGLNSAFSPKNEWQLFDTIQYSSFFKFDLEQIYLKTLTPTKAFALRANIGVALPYGRFSDVVPYVKQFHIGGPNSIRAWSIRELGPGGYRDTISVNNNSPFYQTGDLKMELNMEYRFDLFWVIEGALFLDMGNVWTLKEDPDRENAQISKDFWRQFAVGTGIGFRMDFSFFIMRFDFGYPLRNNYKNEKGKYWLDYSDPDISVWDNFNFNLAIGYPF